MPIRYKAEYFEYPKHLELPVHKELPEGFEERATFTIKEAWTRINWKAGKDELKFMVWCPHCAGWVPGQAHEHKVNNLDGSRLAGRKGTEYYCPRCAEQIAFSGMMS